VLIPLAILGLCLQLIASLVAPTLDGYPSAGNPAMWFPSACYGLMGILVALSIWRSRQINHLLVILLLAVALMSFLHNHHFFPKSSLSKLVIRNGIFLSLGFALLLWQGLSLTRALKVGSPAIAGIIWYVVSPSPTAGFMACGCCAFSVLCAYYLESVKEQATENLPLTPQPSATSTR